MPRELRKPFLAGGIFEASHCKRDLQIDQRQHIARLDEQAHA
jgi:hypothetical protein